MKKQLFIITMLMIALPAGLCGYGRGGAAPARQTTDQGNVVPPPGGQGTQTITTASALVNAFPANLFPNAEQDLIAGAAQAVGSTTTEGNPGSLPGLAAQAFVRNNTVTLNANGSIAGNKSARLGRLGHEQKSYG